MTALPRVFPHPFESSRLLIWEAPYRMPRFVASPRELEATRRRGSVLVLRVDGTVAGSVVAQALGAFTRGAPWLSTMVVAEHYVPATTLLELARRVGFHACDAVLPLAPNDSRGLRILLGSAAVDPEVVVTWAENLRPEVGRLRRELIEYLTGDDPLEDHRALRNALRSASLPSPTSWMRMVGLLPTMIELQTGSSTVAETAFAAGFADAASLSRAIYRLVRLRPIELRGVFGWRWIAYRWLRVAGADQAQPLPRRPVRTLGTPIFQRSLAKAV